MYLTKLLEDVIYINEFNDAYWMIVGRGGGTLHLHHKHLALLSSAYDGGEIGSTALVR
jgi:hypothetical protein